jgi:hypothetical protein
MPSHARKQTRKKREIHYAPEYESAFMADIAHSKKLEIRINIVALCTYFYNFARINSADRMSPALAVMLTELCSRLFDQIPLASDIAVDFDKPNGLAEIQSE